MQSVISNILGIEIKPHNLRRNGWLVTKTTGTTTIYQQTPTGVKFSFYRSQTNTSPTYDIMSDTESVVSSVCENVSSATSLSDTESIESSESENFERKTLNLYEYVSVTINIEATLASDFKRHAKYYRTPGKFFRVDSPEAVFRMYQLIDEFLETYDIPTARRSHHYANDETFEYPRFIPSTSIQLAFGWLPMSEFEFLPVYVQENKRTLFQGSPYDRLMFAEINQSVPSPDCPLYLRTNRPLPVEHALFQGLSSKSMFTIGTITDGPQTLLRPNSITIVERAFPIAKHISLARINARSQKDSKILEESSCSSHQRRQLKQLASVILDNDVVVDVDRSIGMSASSMGLTTDEEVDRVREISEYFCRWCMTE